MTIEVKDWKAALTEQEDQQLGCIPWSFQWMIRLRNANVDYAAFQQEFNLQAQGVTAKHYSCVADAIMLKYPAVKICWRGFPKSEGDQKIAFLDELLQHGKPSVYALTFPPQQNRVFVHITPVIYSDDDSLKIVHSYDATSQKAAVLQLTKDTAIHIHNHLPGGDDIAWLEQP
jgi:hypothetical protein